MSTLFTSGIKFYSIKKGGNRVGIQTLWTHNHIWWWWEWWMLNGEDASLKGGTNYHTKKAAAKRWRRRPHAFSWIFSCPPKKKILYLVAARWLMPTIAVFWFQLIGSINIEHQENKFPWFPIRYVFNQNFKFMNFKYS